jgi:CubicO group peptidase (beta-lactamase class C family)
VRPATSTGPSAARRPTAELCTQAIELGATAVVLIHDGQPLLAHGDVNTPVAVQSIRKSLLSALVGIAIDNRALDLSTTLLELGIDDHPPLTASEKTATVADLLAARSGVYLPLGAGLTMPGRPERGSHLPGTHWYYNNWDFNVLGNALERATGKSVHAAFDHHLARPLGMQDWRQYDHSAYAYRHDPLGGNLTYANYTFALSARDLARFGQLYLQRGAWLGTSVVPPDWVQASTQPLAATGLGGIMRNYGYCWWVAGPGDAEPIPPDTFTAWGLSGNFVTVVPSLQLVLVVLVDRTRPPTGSPTGSVISTTDYSRLLAGLTQTLPAPDGALGPDS